MVSTSFVVSSVILLGVAYYLYTPLPQRCKEPNKQRAVTAYVKIIHILGWILERLGLGSDAHAWRLLIPTTKADDPNMTIEDVHFDRVLVRLYQRKDRGKGPTPGVVYIHGGGFVFGSIDTHDSIVRKFAASTDPHLIIVSIEYRLAPEHPFPTPFDDCYTATRYFLSHTEELGVDPQRLIMMGDSAGGALVAAVVNKLIAEGVQPRPALQILVYPTLQGLNFRTSSYLQYDGRGERGMLTSHAMVYFWLTYAFGKCENTSLYLRNAHISDEIRKSREFSLFSQDLSSEKKVKEETGMEKLHSIMDEAVKTVFLNPSFSPMFASDDVLRNAPRTFIMTCDFDPLSAEGRLYADRLRQLGVAVVYKHYGGYDHGVLVFELYDGSQLVFDDIMVFIKENLR